MQMLDPQRLVHGQAATGCTWLSSASHRYSLAEAYEFISWPLGLVYMVLYDVCRSCTAAAGEMYVEIASSQRERKQDALCLLSCPFASNVSRYLPAM